MFNKFFGFIRRIYYYIWDNDIFAYGAQMAYYLVLSFFPFLIFLVALISYSPLSGQQVLERLLRILPEEAFILVRDTVIEAVETRRGGLAPISGIMGLWFASNGIDSIRIGLNKVYKEEEKRPFWKVKLISIIFALLFFIAVIFSFVLLIFGGVIKKWLKDSVRLIPLYQRIWNVGRYIFISSIIFIIFIILYKYAPNRHIKWKGVIPGAMFSTIGWLGTSLGFAYYVDNFGNYSRFYGSIGGAIILLVWLYFSAIIILLGGKINAILNHRIEGTRG